uniref:Glycosyltransferase 8 domain containing 2 n=1 Tax=Electrophorus electricus TaxID=8005 RepID=A0AAY5ECU9_ELEEL
LLLCVSVNRVLLIFLILLSLALLYKKMLRVEETEFAPGVGTDVPVVICASEERVGAAMATINSVYSNTQANVFFYIVTLRDAVELVRQYIENTKLKDIRYKILEFNPMVLKGKVKLDSSRPDLLHPLNFVRFYLPLLAVSTHRRVVYLDDDVIVQGDIQELYRIQLQTGHAAAFASDCDLPASHEMVRTVGMQTTFMGFLDYRKQEVRDLGIDPSDYIEEWLKQKITKQLEKWMSENFKENLYSSAMAGGVATPPMLIVFHNKYTTIDPKWHVRHLGWSPDAHYAKSVLKGAKLLHWNGHFKPWYYPCVHLDLWEKWFIPDPSGKFSLMRPKT